MLEFEKRRPVDVLHQMLEERSSTKLEQFFKSYGAAEVAAMCFLLVNAPPPDASVVRLLGPAAEAQSSVLSPVSARLNGVCLFLQSPKGGETKKQENAQT